MKHDATCSTCVDKDGNPQSQCDTRKTCYDDASTTTRRKQILLEIPKVIEQ
jgi:hypothetical protein